MINLIAACDENRVIGNRGKLPWTIEEDWKYFLDATRDGILIMGRRCYKEFEQFAKDREVIALSRDPKTSFSFATKAGSLTEALASCRAQERTAWVCGGSEIYREALPLANKLYLTLINASFEGDVFFPPWEDSFFREISKTKVQAGPYELTFLVLGK
mgnify:FL=1